MDLIITTIVSQVLGTACMPPYYPNPCYQPCPPVPRDDCIPNERANDLLKDIETLLSNLTTTLNTQSKTNVESTFNTLNNTVAALNLKNFTEVRNLSSKLESDVLGLIDLKLVAMQTSLEKTVKTEFDKLESSTVTQNSTTKALMATTIDTVSKLPEADAAAKVRDIEFGLQAKIFSQLEAERASIDVFVAAALNNILEKSRQTIRSTILDINNGIDKLFDEYYKSLNSLNTKYTTDLKRDIDSARNKLMNEMNSTFTTIINKDIYFIVGLVRKLVETLTGCPQGTDDIYPLYITNSPLI